MFVRKDETGHVDVIISDAGKAVRRSTGYYRRQNEPAVATTLNENGNNVILTGPRHMQLEGMHMGLGIFTSARGLGRTLSLRSSPPWPSATYSPVAGMTPARDRAQELTFTWEEDDTERVKQH